MSETFKAGDRVKLKANPSEGWPEEMATVLGDAINGTYMVEVDEIMEDEMDDGLREVTVDQMERP